MWPRWLTDPWQGKTSLSRAFWLYCVGTSIVYGCLEGLFPQSQAGYTLYMLLGLLLGIVQSIILWRCAPNSGSRFIAGLVRATAVLSVIVMPPFVYLLLTRPDLLDLLAARLQP